MDAFLSLITVIYHRKTSTLLIHTLCPLMKFSPSPVGWWQWLRGHWSEFMNRNWMTNPPCTVPSSTVVSTSLPRNNWLSIKSFQRFFFFFFTVNHFEWSVRLHNRAPPSYADAASAKRKRTIAAMKWLRWDACVRSDSACKRESRNREQSEKSLSCSSAAAEWVNRKSFKIKWFSEWFAAHLSFFLCFPHSLFPVSPYIIYLYCAKDSELAASASRQTVFFFIHEKPVIQWNNMLLMNEQEKKKYI